MVGLTRHPVLLHVFPTFDVGGSQIRFSTLANRLSDRYRHVIVAMDNRHGAADLLRPGVDFTLRRYELNKSQTLRNLRIHRRLIAEYGADRLFTYNWGATEWGLANLVGGIPHTHIEDGFGPEEATRQLPRRVWFRRLALARAKPIVLPSRTLFRIAREVWRFPETQLAYIPNGVDCSRFEHPPDAALVQALGIHRDRNLPVIGTVAGLRPEKNIARLLRTFATVRAQVPAQLVIVGDGAERPALEQLADELGILPATVFAGRVDRVERILGTFSIYAISSDTEQMPISLIEAMAAELPVAAVDVGDIRLMVDVENHPFVTTTDDAALAAAMLKLLAAPEARRAIGRANAIKARREFGETAMVAAYDSLYSGAHSTPRS